MADIVVLPPQDVVGEHLMRLLQPLLPHVRISAHACVQLLQALAPETILVHRDELPEGETLADALRDGFGATADDRITTVTLEAPEAYPMPLPAPFGVGIPTISTGYLIPTR